MDFSRFFESGQSVSQKWRILFQDVATNISYYHRCQHTQKPYHNGLLQNAAFKIAYMQIFRQFYQGTRGCALY